MAEGDATHKRALRRCHGELIEDLDFESILDYLISKEVFPMTRFEDMKDEKYSSERKRALLENVEKANPSVYKTFLKGLRDTKQDHLRSLLLKEENKVKTEMSQKNGGRQTEKSTKSAESPSKLGEMKADANITAASVVRPKPTSAQVDTSGLKRMTENLSLQELPVGGKNVTDGCQPSAAVEFRNVKGKEPIHKKPSDVIDGPTPVFDELNDPRESRLDKGTASSSDLNHRKPNIQNSTQTAAVGDSTQDPLDDTTEEPDKESGHAADGNSCKPYLSLGNFCSYADLQEKSNPATIPSIVKAQHYCQEPEGSTSIQPQSVNAQKDPNTSVPSGDTLSERPPRSSVCQNRNSNPMTQVEQDQGATPTIPLPPRTSQERFPMPAMPTDHNAPSRQPSTNTAANALPDRLAALDTSDEHMFLKEVFDACVIYRQQCRNHAEEIVKFIRSLPEGYKVCYYDDDSHFGLFPPDSHPEVLHKHCILHLIVISDNLKEDKDADFISKTITMLNKHNAQVRSVLFKEEDEKYIPKSMANTKKIAWYHWHDEGKGHLKENFDSLLRQCKAIRKQKESQNVRSKKHVDENCISLFSSAEHRMPMTS